MTILPKGRNNDDFGKGKSSSQPDCKSCGSTISGEVNTVKLRGNMGAHTFHADPADCGSGPAIDDEDIVGYGGKRIVKRPRSAANEQEENYNTESTGTIYDERPRGEL